MNDMVITTPIFMNLFNTCPNNFWLVENILESMGGSASRDNFYGSSGTTLALGNSGKYQDQIMDVKKVKIGKNGQHKYVTQKHLPLCCRNPSRRRSKDSLIPTIMNSPWVMKGNFNAKRVWSPKWWELRLTWVTSGEFTIPTPSPEGIFIVLR